MFITLTVILFGMYVIKYKLNEQISVLAASDQQQKTNWKSVEKEIGISGKEQPDGVFKFSLPRSDLKVTIKGVPIKPAFALGSWLAFKKMDSEAVVMGDLVLTEDEVNPVMAKLLQEGINVTALHNHLLGESPRIMYMHIHGRGNAVRMAASLRSGLELTKTPMMTEKEDVPQNLLLDTKHIDRIIGHKGARSNGDYQFSIPRAEKITENGIEIAPTMGTATAINFQPTGESKVAITGDFVLTANEVNPVARALRKKGIEITALHNHMLKEEPRLFYMHFWANDDTLKLAEGLRDALNETNSVEMTK
jgi:hypothetical protein